MSDGYDPLAAMEQAGAAVATLTGIKQQFVAAGWNEHNAELATIELIAASTSARR